MALSITDLKKGTVFQLEGRPYRVLDYSQKVMGRGGSIVNVKLRGLQDGRIREKTFKGNEHLESADVASLNAQFLYADDKNAYFMQNDTFENHELARDSIGTPLAYLKEGAIVQLLIFNGHAIGIEPPKNVYLQVAYTETVVKGDTTSAVTKDAKLETGAVVKVPAFIKTGDTISVDVTTGNYRERKKE